MVERHPLMKQHHEAQALMALGIESHRIDATMSDLQRWDTSKLWQGIRLQHKHCGLLHQVAEVPEEELEQELEEREKAPQLVVGGGDRVHLGRQEQGDKPSSVDSGCKSTCDVDDNIK